MTGNWRLSLVIGLYCWNRYRFYLRNKHKMPSNNRPKSYYYERAIAKRDPGIAYL